MGFVVDKAALGEVSSEYFGSNANHSTDFSSSIIIWGWYSRSVVVPEVVN
jgi:hypothetical protein